MAGESTENQPMQRTYIDSSVWIAMLAQEANSDALLAYLDAFPQQLITAEWTRTEMAGALGIKARRRELTQADVSTMLEAFELWIPAGLSMAVVQSDDFLLAAKICENIETKMRCGDALHLAVAHRWQATHLFTLDRDMQRHAQVLNMQIVKPNENPKFTH